MDANLVDGLTWYVVFLFSTCCHEAAHAWSAHRLGDDTAYRGGQVSLHPLPHIQREPIGMVVVPLLSYFFGGWMIGWASAPYDPDWATRYPRRSALMALAGPAANLALILAAAILIRLGCEWGFFQATGHGSFLNLIGDSGNHGVLGEYLSKLLSLCFCLNLLLCAFNLLPVPPLDGSSIPLFFLEGRTMERYFETMRQPAFSMIGLIVAWRVFDFVFPPLFSTAANLLYRLLPAG